MPRKNTREKDAPERERGKGPGPRPFWAGTIAFGLVNLPVSLFHATRSNRVALRMLDEDGTPLSRRYCCPKDNQTLGQDEIVRGYEVEKDRFVVITDEELDALAPEKSQEINLQQFVSLSEIDPTYFERAYFLAPERGASKAYRLLAKSMEDAQRAGIATAVMRGKEYLLAIIAEYGILRAEILRFHDELRTPADVGLPEAARADTARVRKLSKSITALAAEKPDEAQLADRYSHRLLERVQEKLEAGEDVVHAEEVPETEEDESSAEIVDLMEVLKRSLDQAPSGDEGTTPTKTELYRRARELGVPGRSNMNREELLEAVGETQ